MEFEKRAQELLLPLKNEKASKTLQRGLCLQKKPQLLRSLVTPHSVPILICNKIRQKLHKTTQPSIIFDHLLQNIEKEVQFIEENPEKYRYKINDDANSDLMENTNKSKFVYFYGENGQHNPYKGSVNYGLSYAHDLERFQKQKPETFVFELNNPEQLNIDNSKAFLGEEVLPICNLNNNITKISLFSNQKILYKNEIPKNINKNKYHDFLEINTYQFIKEDKGLFKIVKGIREFFALNNHLNQIIPEFKPQKEIGELFYANNKVKLNCSDQKIKELLMKNYW